jgi:hypothetical protein
MALVACRECKKKVSAAAKACPHCGIENPFVISDKFLDADGKLRELSAAECNKLSIAERKAYQIAGGKLKLSLFQKIMSFFLFVIVAFFTVAMVRACNRPLSPEEQAAAAAKTRPEKAVSECRYAVKQSLRDPDSADFVKYIEERRVAEVKPKHFVISMPVQGKNAFNATIKNVFTCEVVEEADGSMRLKSIK